MNPFGNDSRNNDNAAFNAFGRSTELNPAQSIQPKAFGSINVPENREESQKNASSSSIFGGTYTSAAPSNFSGGESYTTPFSYQGGITTQSKDQTNDPFSTFKKKHNSPFQMIKDQINLYASFMLKENVGMETIADLLMLIPVLVQILTK